MVATRFKFALPTSGQVIRLPVTDAKAADAACRAHEKKTFPRQRGGG
jgi:hypothetical protein